jgi:hypothetical protein
MVPFGELVSRDPQHGILIPSAYHRKNRIANLSFKTYFLHNIKRSRLYWCKHWKLVYSSSTGIYPKRMMEVTTAVTSNK